MPVEFIGMIRGYPGSEADAARSATETSLDPEYLKHFARVHEDGEFDRVLIGYGSTGPDGWTIAAWAAAATERLKFLIAHRPGFVQPTLAARKAITLDVLTGGRIALHIITGGSDAEEQRDGDFLTKDTRYRRTNEYLEVVKKVWTSTEPFDHDGEFYHFKNAFSALKSPQEPHIPLYFGGSSGPALEVGARQADVWASWGAPVAAIRDQVNLVQNKAAEFGRKVGISVSLRPILGATEEKAWERAYAILERVKSARTGLPPRVPQNAGSQRLLKFAEDGDVLDKRLFTAIAKETGAGGNSTALVGTPDQVAESLLDYVDAGVTTILIRGFDPLQDAIEYGRDLLPIVRAEIARRDRSLAATAV